jgi:hypothetical protein
MIRKLLKDRAARMTGCDCRPNVFDMAHEKHRAVTLWQPRAGT